LFRAYGTHAGGQSTVLGSQTETQQGSVAVAGAQSARHWAAPAGERGDAPGNDSKVEPSSANDLVASALVAPVHNGIADTAAPGSYATKLVGALEQSSPLPLHAVVTASVPKTIAARSQALCPLLPPVACVTLTM
jgi:hypothetical protein